MMYLICGAAHDKFGMGILWIGGPPWLTLVEKRLDFFLISDLSQNEIHKEQQLLPGFSIDSLLISAFITCGFACFSVYVHEWMVQFSQLKPCLRIVLCLRVNMTVRSDIMGFLGGHNHESAFWRVSVWSVISQKKWCLTGAFSELSGHCYFWCVCVCALWYVCVRLGMLLVVSHASWLTSRLVLNHQEPLWSNTHPRHGLLNTVCIDCVHHCLICPFRDCSCCQITWIKHKHLL